MSAHSSPHLRAGVMKNILHGVRRAQRAQAQKASKVAQPPVMVLYASQTGTAQEIARSIQATSGQHGIKSQVIKSQYAAFSLVHARHHIHLLDKPTPARCCT